MVLPSVPAQLTLTHAWGYLRDCEAALRSHADLAGAVVTVDASALVEFDSSALAVLLGIRRRVLQLGAVLKLAGVPAKLRDLATLYGVSELLPA